MDKDKRYSLTVEERDEFKNLQRIFDDVYFHQQGLKALMDNLLRKVTDRVKGDIGELPKGMKRVIDFDPATYELKIRIVPINIEKAFQIKQMPKK